MTRCLITLLGTMLGHQFFATVPDIDRTDYFLMLGTNPKISNGAMMSTGANVHKKLNAIRERGGKTVLIDPRRNELRLTAMSITS